MRAAVHDRDGGRRRTCPDAARGPVLMTSDAARRRADGAGRRGTQRCGAVAARRAHNPQAGGSIPPSATDPEARSPPRAVGVTPATPRERPPPGQRAPGRRPRHHPRSRRVRPSRAQHRWRRLERTPGGRRPRHGPVARSGACPTARWAAAGSIPARSTGNLHPPPSHAREGRPPQVSRRHRREHRPRRHRRRDHAADRRLRHPPRGGRAPPPRGGRVLGWRRRRRVGAGGHRRRASPTRAPAARPRCDARLPRRPLRTAPRRRGPG